MQYKLFKQRTQTRDNYELENSLMNKYSLSPLAAKLLVKRGHLSLGDAGIFLYPDEEHLYSPFMFRDMKKAVERIWHAYETNQKITIYGDYDCDGVCATAIIYTALEKMGCDVDFYIPDRFSDGYGMNNLSIQAIAETGTKLIITVDNGITALNEIDLAGRLGIDVILTDHHACPDEIPECYALLNPHNPSENYPFEELCGAGVALKLAMALDILDEDETKKMIILAGVASIADLVSLTGENRTLSSLALKYIAMNLHPGISALAKQAEIDIKEIKCHEISYQIAPRINAAGRLYSADIALDLLLSKDKYELEELARDLDDINNERKDIESAIHVLVNEYIAGNDLIEKQTVLFVRLEDENEGVIGIAAGKAAQQYNMPVVICCEKDGIIKASARSVAGFDIYKALREADDLYIKFGGHSQAAGFSIEADKFDELTKIVNDYADTLDKKRFLFRRCYYDLEATSSQLTTKAIRETELFAPFGIANPKPVYKLERARFSNLQLMGKDKNHFRAILIADDFSLPAVMFNAGSITEEISTDGYYDILFTAGINTYRGKNTVQLEIKEIIPHVPCPENYYMSLYTYFNKNFALHDSYIIPEEKFLPLTLEGALEEYEDTVFIAYGKDTLIRCLYYSGYIKKEIVVRYGRMNAYRLNAINLLVNPVDDAVSLIKGKRIVVLDSPCYFAPEENVYEGRDDVFFIRSSGYSEDISFSREYVLFIYKQLRNLPNMGNDIYKFIAFLNLKATFKINYFSLLISLDMMRQMEIIDYYVEENTLNVTFLKITSQKDINSTPIMIELSKR